MYLLFDIGATKTRLAVSKDKRSFDKPVIFDTPKDFNEGIKKIVKEARKLTPNNFRAVCGGITGTLDKDHSKLTRSPNLSSWVMQPIQEKLEQEFKCPVFIENDAAIVGLGEALAGSGIGDSIVVYITVSTGVGGVRIVNGEIDEHSYGFEPGNELLDMQHSLEDMVSGSAVMERFNKKPFEIPQSDHLWNELAEKLAFGLHNSIVHWSPDSIVLGGSMIVGDPAIRIEDVKRYLKEISKVYPNIPEIKKARLGAFGGIYGAIYYLNNRLND
ncbi:MAG: ROK family protein [Candidatus Pacebacteria bacterium]|nr:ROK family protein [Candidatus Paceibacterota bacterium]